MSAPLSLLRTALFAAPLLAASLAPAASYVKLDFTGTSNVTIPSAYSEPYSSYFIYDTSVAADPDNDSDPSTEEFQLAFYDGYNTGAFFITGSVFVQNHVQNPVTLEYFDVLHFNAGDFFFIGTTDNNVTVILTDDFLSAPTLPTLAEFQSAITGGKVVDVYAYGDAVAIGVGPTTIFEYETSDDPLTITATDFAVVPTPAASLGALPLLALLAANHPRRRPTTHI